MNRVFVSLIPAVLLASLFAPEASAGQPCPVDHCVRIEGNAYVEATLEIWPGETVRFEYSGEHPFRQVRSATGTTAFTPNPLLCDDIEVTLPNCEKTFTVPGDFFYICVAHAFMDMRGSIRVLDPGLFRNDFE